MKRCKKCRKQKYLTQFGKDCNNRLDGHKATCALCQQKAKRSSISPKVTRLHLVPNRDVPAISELLEYPLVTR